MISIYIRRYPFLDKEFPTVTNCPKTMKKISADPVVRVFWTEPQFRDNQVIKSISRSHAPGQYFTRGDFIVTYVARDLAGNSVSCTFELYVMGKEDETFTFHFRSFVNGYVNFYSTIYDLSLLQTSG